MAALGQDTVGTGSVRGTVVRPDGAPVEGVRVCIAGTERCAATDASGRFDGLDVRPGSHGLVVQLADGAEFTTSAVEAFAGLTSEVRLDLPEIAAVTSSVTVSASELLAPDEVATSGVRIDSRPVAKTAGALQDVSRYVSTLPGVSTGSADFRNDIIVRGGSPLENLFIVDNIEIPNINSFANFSSAGGTVSLLDVQLIEDVTFLTGGYPAPYPNRLSSVMQVAQREGSRDRFRSRATLAYAGAGGVLEGPWAGGDGSWIVSARRSFLDFFIDDIGFGGVPVYYSFTAKAVRDFGVKDRVWATSISGIDSVRLGPTEDFGPEDELSTLDIRYSGARTASGVNWQRIFGARGVGLLGFTFSRAGVDTTVKDLLGAGLFEPGSEIDQVIADGIVTFRQDSTETETTAKYDLTLHAGRFGEFRLGGAQKFFSNDYMTRSPLGYDGPFTLVPGTNPIDLREPVDASRTEAYLQTTQALGSRVRLTLGGRLDRFRHFGLAHRRFSPRAGLSVALSRDWSVNGSWGLYHQMPLYLFLAAFPGNRGLLPSRAEHRVGGFAWTPGRNVRVTLEAYSKRYKDYPAAAQFPALSFANVGDTFNVRDILYPMLSAGRGEAGGVEFFAERRFAGNWFGQLNVAYSRARHAGRDRTLRPGAFDRPFVLNVVAGRTLFEKWDIGLRTSYLTGRPFTPFHEDLSRAQRRGIFDLDRVNALRLRPFFTLDLRLDRTLRIREKVLVIYGGVQNVTGRANQTGVWWNQIENRPGFNTGIDRFLLLGMEWAI